MSKGVVLLSGGLDSSVTASKMKDDLEYSRNLYAMTFDYGQRHSKEIQCAYKVAEELGISKVHHPLVKVDFSPFGTNTSLVNKELDIPSSGLKASIPSTWVPQRNSIFLAIAFAFAETVGAKYVYAGMNAVDYSGYPDCRPEFLKSMEDSLNLGSKDFVEKSKRIFLITPLLKLSKSEIVRLGLNLRTPFQYTWSCYKGREKACGTCDSCRIRRKAFRDLGYGDYIEYEEEVG